MRRTALALAALLLAGCAHPTAPEDGATDPPPLLRHDRPVSASITAKDNLACPPPVGCGYTSETLLAELRGNETARGFRLDVTASGVFGLPGQPFHIEVRCAGTRGCEAPLAEHDGAAPFRLESDATLPPLTVLTVGARALDTTPDPYELRGTFVTVAGTLSLEATPGPPPQLAATPLHLRGISGACAFETEANCTNFPYGSSWDVPVAGTLRHVDLTATWTPLSPASQTMRLSV
ncbi:MAG: hypothetical protein ABR586_04965, partial [Thermoplasmatota archaeon]